MNAIRNLIGSLKPSGRDNRRFSATSLLLLVIATLLAASLACNLPGFRRSPGSQLEPLPVTTEAAGQLEDNIDAAADALLNGQPFTLTVDEAQLTSSVNLKLGSFQEAQVQNLQIYLRDGQVMIFGDAVRDGLNLPFSFAVRVFAANGSVAYEIVEAKIGPFPIPGSIMDELEAQLDQFILDQLGPDASGLVIEEITIANGLMTISGRAR